MSKKTYVLLFVTLVVSVALTAYSMVISKKETNTMISFSNRPYSPTVQCIDKETRPVASLKVDRSTENNNDLTILNLWYDLEDQNEKIAIRLDPRIKGAKKIGFNSRIIAILKKNDKFQLPAIDNKKYLLHIKSIKKNNNTNIEIYGEFDYNGKIYASTLSLTKKGVLALLSTPKGYFDVRLAHDKGYIYQSTQLEDIEAVIDLPGFLN